MPTERPNGYFTAKDVAAILDVDPKTVGRWAREGKLPYTRTLGGHRRYRPAEIEEIAARQVFTPAKEGDPKEEATA